MSANPLVSVIIPVYNVERYLHECVQSIVAQSYTSLEILLVDDGSTDGSGVLCDELAKTDERIVVYHKENGGLSDARNYGLARCKGEWVSFIDSDDYVSPVFIEVLLNAARETGCLISAIPFGKPFKDGEPCELVDSLCPVAPAKPLASPCVQGLMLYQALDTGAQWRLYARASLGIDPFPKGLYYEDLASVYKILHGVERVAVLDCRDLYAYRMRGDSIIRQCYRHIKAESALKISDRLYCDICSWYPELASGAASRCFSVCRMVFAQVPIGKRASGEALSDRKALWDVLKCHRVTILFDKHARKRERLAAAIACLGMHSFSLFCRAMRRMGKLQ